MTDIPEAAVAKGTEGRVRPGRGPFGLLLLLSLLAVAGVAIAWSQPAHNELREAATEQEFIDALKAMPSEWICTTDEYSTEDSLDVTFAVCSVGSEGTDLDLEFQADLDVPEAGSSSYGPYPRCTYIGDHVMVTWAPMPPASDEDAAKVAAALDGWEQLEHQPGGCP